MSDWPEGIGLDPKLWRRANPPPGCADFLGKVGVDVFRVPKPMDLSPSWDAPGPQPHTEWCRRRLQHVAGGVPFWGYFVKNE